MAINCQLCQNTTESGSKLESVGGTQANNNIGVVFQRADDEVSIRRDRILTSYCAKRSAVLVRDESLHKGIKLLKQLRRVYERALLRCHEIIGIITASLDGGLAEARESIETLGTKPDPHREAVGIERSRVGGLVVC